ncbi:hypothetical protein NDU88_003808 [Pleurodeles waltl]|uniref:Uncharacterized protein n=1 Tax=Pleurodeles waltl TaxID=8319 RepID=A0AAV7NJ97_PLEWA|nr:hypothetical protein NDU88_003808 [Pleurodeles waltl]
MTTWKQKVSGTRKSGFLWIRRMGVRSGPHRQLRAKSWRRKTDRDQISPSEMKERNPASTEDSSTVDNGAQGDSVTGTPLEGGG